VTRDPGVTLAVDLARFELRLRDERNGDESPPIRVAPGSPANPTPTGAYAISRVILNPAWAPGALAQEAGARRARPSWIGPMGVGKIPFAELGSIALHGGANPYVLGKPISGGCLRVLDADFLRLVRWLGVRDALGGEHERDDGEIHRPFVRPARIEIR
jgi:hypothetical protein